jgi:hypothetical protein
VLLDVVSTVEVIVVVTLVVSVTVVVADGKVTEVEMLVSVTVLTGGAGAVTTEVVVTWTILQVGLGCHLTQSTPCGYCHALFLVFGLRAFGLFLPTCTLALTPPTLTLAPNPWASRFLNGKVPAEPPYDESGTVVRTGKNPAGVGTVPTIEVVTVVVVSVVAVSVVIVVSVSVLVTVSVPAMEWLGATSISNVGTSLRCRCYSLPVIVSPVEIVVSIEVMVIVTWLGVEVVVVVSVDVTVQGVYEVLHFGRMLYRPRAVAYRVMQVVVLGCGCPRSAVVYGLPGPYWGGAARVRVAREATSKVLRCIMIQQTSKMNGRRISLQ